jgi:hypothetical protein
MWMRPFALGLQSALRWVRPSRILIINSLGVAIAYWAAVNARWIIRNRYTVGLAWDYAYRRAVEALHWLSSSSSS